MDRSLVTYGQEVQGGRGVWLPIARRYREGYGSGYLLPGGTGKDRSLVGGFLSTQQPEKIEAKYIT